VAAERGRVNPTPLASPTTESVGDWLSGDSLPDLIDTGHAVEEVDLGVGEVFEDFFFDGFRGAVADCVVQDDAGVGAGLEVEADGVCGVAGDAEDGLGGGPEVEEDYVVVAEVGGFVEAGGVVEGVFFPEEVVFEDFEDLAGEGVVVVDDEGFHCLVLRGGGRGCSRY